MQHGADVNLWVVSGDSTNTNTGMWGGVTTFLEKLLGHRVHRLICQIHVNELPLRRLIVVLDGPYISKSGFSGPIGKLLEKVNTLKVDMNFDPVEALESMPSSSYLKMSSAIYQQIARTVTASMQL